MLIHERGFSKGPNATRKVLIGREFHLGKVEEVGLRLPHLVAARVIYQSGQKISYIPSHIFQSL